MVSDSNMSEREQAHRDFIDLARRCRARAERCTEEGSPVGAREWIVAAEAAQKAADDMDRYPTPRR